MVKMICESCGTEWEDPVSIFCDNCGMKMQRVMVNVPEEKIEYVRCNKCGAKNKPDATVCFYCGDLIREKREIY